MANEKRNEKVKLTATLINTISGAVVIFGILTPIFTAIFKPEEFGEEVFSSFTGIVAYIIVVVGVSAGFHLLAKNILEDIRE